MNSKKTIIGIGFILATLVLFYFANYIVYKAILLVFNIAGPSLLIIGILGVLGLSFFAAMILGMRYYNVFTQTYSSLSMIWLGLLGYFFVASIIYMLDFRYFGDPSRMFTFIIFGLCVVVGFYEIFRSENLVEKEVEVKLHGLPAVWKERKLVWISDLHIGQINREGYVGRVIDKLREVSPDILFIGGDLFDGPSSEEILNCILPFHNLFIPLGIYFVTGNHESYGKSELFLKKISEVGIRILHNEKVIIDGLQIIGVDFSSTAKKEDFKKVLTSLQIDKSVPSILLKHEPININIAEKAGISFQISGHTHKGQQWPFEYIARAIYGRFTYGLNRLRNIQVYTSSGTGTWGPPMRVGTDCEIVIFSLI